jgi:hypothetical protein
MVSTIVQDYSSGLVPIMIWMASLFSIISALSASVTDIQWAVTGTGFIGGRKCGGYFERCPADGPTAPGTFTLIHYDDGEWVGETIPTWAKLAVLSCGLSVVTVFS